MAGVWILEDKIRLRMHEPESVTMTLERNSVSFRKRYRVTFTVSKNKRMTVCGWTLKEALKRAYVKVSSLDKEVYDELVYTRDDLSALLIWSEVKLSLGAVK